MTQESDAAGDTPPGWAEFVESLRTLPSRLLARLPAEQRADPQLQQEVARLALEALASGTLDVLNGAADHPAFLTQIGQVLNVGQPNADTIYRVARVAPDGVYRLTGRRGSLRMFNLSQSPPSPWETGFRREGGLRTRHDFGDLAIDADGRFAVVLSAERPDDHDGDWWKLEPTTNKLLVRMVSADWTGEQDPTLAIERLDVDAARPRPTAAELEGRLRMLPKSIDFLALLFVDHVEKLRQEGFVNRLKIFDVTTMGGLAGQFYYEGAYDLADDEALIIESPVPERCGYRSLILTNNIYETTDWINNHSSLNAAQAEPDSDGILRFIVSAKDPGVPNWLDTAGYAQGLVQGRWTDCDSQPMPSVRKVAFDALRSHLPADTPSITTAERDRLIRARRAAFQQRPLW